MYTATVLVVSTFSASGFPAEIYDEVNQPDIKLLFDKTMAVRILSSFWLFRTVLFPVLNALNFVRRHLLQTRNVLQFAAKFKTNKLKANCA